MIQQFQHLPQDTQIFIGIIGILALLFHSRYTVRVVGLGPTILTTFGIFATFFGVARGLSNFDTLNVQASIPELLSGLKTAFWASVCGVGAALSLKMRELLAPPKDKSTDSGRDDVSGADILKQLAAVQAAINGPSGDTMVSQLKLARQDANERLAPLADIRKGLIGDEEGSLIGQIRLLRLDMNDRLSKLVQSQEESLRRLAEMGTGALIEALRDVIRDFNQKISEQFGENFRELNSAVRLLVDWQDGYKATVESTFDQLKILMGHFSKTAEDFGALVERAHGFADTAERLGQLLSALTMGEERLRTVAEGLGQLLTSASGSLPQVEQKVVEMATQMAAATQQNEALLRSSIEETTKSLRQSVDSAMRAVTGLTEELSRTLIASANQSAVRVEENTKIFTSALERSKADTAAANAEFNRHLNDLLQKTRDQFVALDMALASELNRSLEGLAGQLTALSQQFVRDYEPLTRSLKQVVEMSRGLQ